MLQDVLCAMLVRKLDATDNALATFMPRSPRSYCRTKLGLSRMVVGHAAQMYVRNCSGEQWYNASAGGFVGMM